MKLVTNLHLAPQLRMSRAYFHSCICHLHTHTCASASIQQTLSHTPSHPLTRMFGFRVSSVKIQCAVVDNSYKEGPQYMSPLCTLPPPPASTHTHTHTHTYFVYFNVYNGKFVIRVCAILASVPSNLSDSSRSHSTAPHAMLNPSDINFPVKCLA